MISANENYIARGKTGSIHWARGQGLQFLVLKHKRKYIQYVIGV